MAVSETLTVNGVTPELRVTVVALHKGRDAGPYQHFQSARRCVADPSIRPFSEAQEECLKKVDASYFAMEHKAKLPLRTKSLADAVPGPFDAILSPASDFPEQAGPFRKKMLETFSNAIDLTPFMKRRDDAKRAASGASIEEVAAGLSYSGRDLDEVGSLLVVDDTFKDGTTIGAVVSVLRKHGLKHDARIVLACPLWLVPSKKP